jgi:hypothetical protein
VDLPVEEAEYYKMAHAKNVAHRMATGDVLCNLDCDYITSTNFAGWLNQQFANDDDTIACLTTRDRLVRRITTGERSGSLIGKIALARHNFEKLHGYDEENYNAWGGGDLNLIARAEAAGLTKIPIPISHYGSAIAHSDEERTENMSPKDQELSQERIARNNTLTRAFKEVISIFHPSHTHFSALSAANKDGKFGCATVIILNENLGPVTHQLEPVDPSQQRPLRCSSQTKATAARG